MSLYKLYIFLKNINKKTPNIYVDVGS